MALETIHAINRKREKGRNSNSLTREVTTTKGRSENVDDTTDRIHDMQGVLNSCIFLLNLTKYWILE